MLNAALFTLSADDLGIMLNSPLFLTAAGLAIAAFIARKPLHGLATWLHADATHRLGLAKALEDDVGSLADHAQDFLGDNQQSLKDMMDPAKRAAAEAQLGKKAIAALITQAEVKG